MSKDYQLTVSEYDKYSYVMNLSKQNVCLYKFHIINSHINIATYTNLPFSKFTFNSYSSM